MTSALSGRSGRRRRWVVAGILLGTYGSVYLALVGVFALVHGGPVDWGRPIGGVVGGAVGVWGVLWWQSRRLGGLDGVDQLRQAAKRGRLPDDADPAVWGPLLTRQVRTMRRLRPWALTGLGLLSVVALGLLVVVAAMPWGWGVLAVLVLGSALGLLWWQSRREERRLRRLLEQLPDSDGVTAV
ncbi:hypothetical protein [Modestobacter roseus]|uniref:hypothetical protein n=1 Tax=Modestobacter roseus TaxID=1181884 RepID=UPI001295E4E0|nr:hypothetical protein [Modestobacter roseus]MQA36305.1 hypothetical protein [Modestobacter roseus]